MNSTVEKWRMHEITFTSVVGYDSPFDEAELSVTFTGPQGGQLVRPGFWYGKNIWKVRIALTELGEWSYKTVCSDRSNDGLHGQTGMITCVPYSGELEIYRHGFLKVGENKRHFAHADGTPFFYLGDTHWFLPHEKFDHSGVEGVPSQFKYMVDKRVSQGFTVFQSEPLFFANYPYIYHLQDGLDEKDAIGFAELDKKFAYIADQGLVHANAELFFVQEINSQAYTPAYLVKLTKYWVARYGAYPVLWTIAQESDPDCYKQVPPDKWFTVAETIFVNDAYHQPLTAHMCNDNVCGAHNTVWGEKYYHSWFGVQPQGEMNNTLYYKGLWEYKDTKPSVNYETGYENLWNDKNGAIGAGYKAFQYGLLGYGYGAHGVWNDNFDRNDWMDYGGYQRWFEGINLPGGARLAFLKQFYSSLAWWDIVPRFDSAEWSDFGEGNRRILATIGQETYTAYFFNNDTATGTLHNLLPREYNAKWYNVDTGTYTAIGTFLPEQGSYVIPAKPDDQPWMLLVSCDPGVVSGESTPLFITAENLETTIWQKGGQLQMSANRDAKWSVTDLNGQTTDLAEITAGGVVTASGKNGIVRICAVDAQGRKAYKNIILLRQDTTFPPAKAKNVSVIGNGHKFTIAAQESKLQILPLFDPADVQDQRVDLVLTAPDGSESKIAYLGANGAVHAIADGQFKMTAKALDGSGIEGSAIFTIEGHGEPSIAAYGEATSSDYHEGYDKRCYPGRAINGISDNFAGWCSEQPASYAAPVWLLTDMKEPKVFNRIDLYTTELGYMLKDFDVQAELDGSWGTLFSVRDNEVRKQSHSFAAVTSSKIRVMCYKGDSNGNARIDQINVYLDK